MGFFDGTRSGCKHGISFTRHYAKQTWWHDTHDCYLKGCAKNSLTHCSFYVMESRVSSNCTCNIHGPKRKAPWERLPKGDGFDSLPMQSGIDLGEILFHNLMFCDELENRDLSSKIYRVSFSGIS